MDTLAAGRKPTEALGASPEAKINYDRVPGWVPRSFPRPGGPPLMNRASFFPSVKFSSRESFSSLFPEPLLSICILFLDNSTSQDISHPSRRSLLTVPITSLLLLLLLCYYSF